MTWRQAKVSQDAVSKNLKRKKCISGTSPKLKTSSSQKALKKKDHANLEKSTLIKQISDKKLVYTKNVCSSKIKATTQ